jgi:hypothetical protein
MKIFLLAIIICFIATIKTENLSGSKQRRAIRLTTTAYTTITPEPTNCSLPKLHITSGLFNRSRPNTIEKSRDIYLVANVTINCIIYTSTRNIKEWSIYKLDETNDQEEKISLNSVTSIYNTELFIHKNTLNYGLYRFIFQVELRSNTSVKSSIETWIRVIESKGFLWVFPNGANSISFGHSQKIILDPLKYSYFNEPNKTFDDYTFSYYCRVLRDNTAEEYPKDTLNTLIDLKKFKENQSAFNVPSNELCLSDTSKYDYIESTKQLIIENLNYKANVSYQFLIVANLSKSMYESLIEIKIDNVVSLPEVTIGCKYREMCFKVKDYYLINPLNKLVLLGQCLDNCGNQSFSIYTRSNEETQWFMVNDTYLSTKTLNASAHELIIYDTFFLGLKTIQFKVEYTSMRENDQNTAYIKLRVNMLPSNGTCSVFPLKGLSLRTRFNISCQDWIDNDGQITKYEYIVVDGMNKITIGYRDSSTLITHLPQGPNFKSYHLQIVIRIYDDIDSYAQFTINETITVEPYFYQANYSTLDDLYTQNLNILNEGNQQYSCNSIMCFASLLNTLNYQNKTNFIGSSLRMNYLTLFGLEQNIPSYVTFDNITNINSTFLGFTRTDDISEAMFEQERNMRSTKRNKLANFIRNMTISDFKSVKLILSTLYLLTLRNDELTRNTAVSLN